MAQKVIFSEQLERTLETAIGECHPDRLFVLTDDNTRRLCWPVVKDYGCLAAAQLITIPAGDEHKNLTSLSHVWEQLQQGGATRHSLMVCLGGGMVTDLGGFAASTFKRGIAFINIPTTLLAMVDASVGGKTGINFCGLKNEVGVFSEAQAVIICTRFLQTLDMQNVLSGYAEMLKHGLISNKEHWAELLRFPIEGLNRQDVEDSSDRQDPSGGLASLLARSVAVKERIVEADPHEQGLRKALNLGHTIGHAIEEWSFKPTPTPLLHGYAVAYGLVGELYLSAVKCHFPTDRLRQTVQFVREHYGTPAITCNDYPALLRLMTHDKKNTAGTINFTLLADIGELQLNQSATDEEICEALDFLREMQ
ncbi:MAG: 3-dehydroquinate synthase [Prevotella sp.]|nr:3-dehydroquinate synthase [Prevotella sp.]